MERKWTDSQKRAIDARDESILISAAAGSGKTATLTQRIIERITDPHDPVSVTELLVVTFTKAAAAELKTRIREAIREKLTEHSDNTYLRDQLLLVNSAQISTIHSFCYHLIRANFQKLGLGGSAKIADETEMKLTSQRVMDALIDDCYENVVNDVRNEFDDFDLFCRRLAGNSADGAAPVLLRIYEKLTNIPEGISWLSEQVTLLTGEQGKPFFETKVGAAAAQHLYDAFSSYRVKIKIAKDAVCGDTLFAPRYGDNLTFYDNQIACALTLIENGEVTKLGELLTAEPPRVGSVKETEKTDTFRDAVKERDAYRKFVSETLNTYFSTTDADCSAITTDHISLLNSIYKLLAIFEKRISAEKRKKNLLTFSDLERLSLSLLYDMENNTPTALACAVSGQFREIYIDEYQDVNPLQDLIFSSIAKPDNLFIVGDIKQSIYGFRGATPALFAKYRAAYAQEDGVPRETIFLSENFRCDDSIIRFSNAIFSVLFTALARTTPYLTEDALIHAKKDDYSDVQERVQVHVFEKKPRGEAAPQTDEDASGVTMTAEALWVAGEIKRLLKTSRKRNGEPLEPGDFAILVRSNKSSAQLYESALSMVGLDSENQATEDFFENPEVLLMLSLLQVINNRSQDIFLAAVLKSPFFHVTLDELIRIRAQRATGSLYQALADFTAAHAFEKGSAFIAKLDAYSRLAEELPVDRLLWYLYTDTGILGMLSHGIQEGDSAEQMQANLMMFYEYARSFTSGAYRGLYQFIAYINEIIRKKTVLKCASTGTDAKKAVQIMTVHQSKGLEFPVCFLCDTGRGFNEDDLKKRFLMSEALGIACKLIGDDGLTVLSTPRLEAVKNAMKAAGIEEELRVLYVALTRAREQLYVTGQTDKPEEFLNSIEKLPPMRYLLMKYASPLKMILHSVVAVKSENCCDITLHPYQPTEEEPIPTVEAKEENSSDFEEQADTYYKILKQRFSYVYPFTASAKIPSKLSVSKLYPGVLDEHDTPVSLYLEGDGFQKKSEYALPDFMKTETGNAAQRGTATHVFMQFCDLSALTKETVEAEIRRLTDEQFILPSDAALIRRDWIAGFLDSALFREMKQAKMLYREKRFTARYPARELTADASLATLLSDETVLIQGVIDCFFENADGSITLVDYKTDTFSRDTDFQTARDAMINRHRIQLLYYKKACEAMTKNRVTSLLIYSFSLAQAIQIPFTED